MKTSKWLKRIIFSASLILSVWLFWPSMAPQQVQFNKIVKQVLPIKTSDVINTRKEPISKVEIAPKHISSNASAKLIASAYAAELNYPPYSQPLRGNDFDRLQPNYFNPQSVPIDDKGGMLKAALSKYRYTYPEPIVALLSGDNLLDAKLELVNLNNGNVVSKTNFYQENGQWKATLQGQKNLPQQLQALINTEINGKQVTIALAVKYVDSIATLTGFEPAMSDGADMVVSANISTREKGLYRLRANLFDANNQPLAHLVAKERLGEGNKQLRVKAHHSVLIGKQAPFYLSTFSIELMSPAPGKPKKYGNSAIKKYVINDFETSSLSEVPYQPSDNEQQRLNLLQQMASGGS
jgi:hypothetical protein